MRVFKRILFLSLIPVAFLLIFTANWLLDLYERVDVGLQQNKFLQPSVIYSAPKIFRPGEKWGQQEVMALLAAKSYRERPDGEELFPGDFSLSKNARCQEVWSELVTAEPLLEPGCLRWKTNASLDPSLGAPKEYALLFAANGRIVGAGPLTKGEYATRALLEPEVIAQYLEGTPLFMQWTPLGETPPQCLNAVMAIEDSDFLEHAGVSPEGLLRAVYKNVVKGQSAQGGSTITQQLVKNYFLTPEKTLKRKATEFFMSLFVERLASKDQIFETYLNVIYLGQSGVFQVRGYGAAAEFYFRKPLGQLNLPECGLLAAILNSPGLYDPFRQPQRALQRRERVLKRMNELKYIDEKELETALKYPLPTAKPGEISETAPYFIQAAFRELDRQGIAHEGVHVFTTLNPGHQAVGQKALADHLSAIEATNPKIKKLKEAGKTMEAVLLSVDHETGWVSAAVGGRNFRTSQFNRLTESKRQIGSLIKPFVYLSAFIQDPELGPVSLISDEPFNHKYEGQSWKPDNYDHKNYGEVPVYYALKKSLNVATAALGIRTGLPLVIETARNAGLESPMKPVPSLTLGSFEMSPFEVLTAYTTLARFGVKQKPLILRSITDARGKTLAEFSEPSERVLPETETALVVGMLRENDRTGTGAAVARSGITVESGGKTGTTSDSRDAWFAGFTPDRTTIVWVGYDIRETHGLTGSSGAVPPWIRFMEQITSHDANQVFTWPPGVELETVRNLDETVDSEIYVRD